MSASGWLQLGALAIVVLGLTRPLGAYLHSVFEGEAKPLPNALGPLERTLHAACGVDPRREQGWREYAASVLLFGALGALAVYALQRLQHVLPLDPQGFGAVPPDLAFSTAASFASNTDWQAYAGEATLGYLVQMAGLAWQNFVSAGTGIGVALALARGLTRRPGPGGPATLGSFWVDLNRSLVYLLLPLSALAALLLVSQGVIQSLAPYVEATTVEGGRQTIALGPVASQESIKLLGTNGGGFFAANSAHPFENPTPLTNLLQVVLILAIPAALTWTYGRMAGDQRQGWALFAAMALLLAIGALLAWAAEAAGNPALRGLGIDQAAGNLEGKEVRFGVAGSALFAVVTTAASCGAVNAALDSFTPIGGLVPLANILLGEVVFGGVGAGLCGMLVFVVLTVFVAGLMVGRTPELLGKKVEAREMKLVMLYLLVSPLLVLGFAGWSAVTAWGVAPLGNAGPHGLSEILYAYASTAGNNGSAFAGLASDTPWYDVTLGLTMLAGRFLTIVPLLAMAGSMVAKRVAPPGPGTLPTGGPLFAGLLVGVVLIVGLLTFLPALSLGPVVEHFLARDGRRF